MAIRQCLLHNTLQLPYRDPRPAVVRRPAGRQQTPAEVRQQDVSRHGAVPAFRQSLRDASLGRQLHQL